MKQIALALLLLFSFLWGAQCEKQLFNLKAMETGGKGITIEAILKDISDSCDLSIIFEDKKAREKIKKRLDFVNIKNYTLEELLDFVLGENNLFYDYQPDRHILKIAYYKTESFPIDYINLSKMVSESKKSVSLGTNTDTSGENGASQIGGATGSSTEEQSNTGESTDYTTITTKSEFTFWDNLEKELKAILSGYGKKRDYSIFINKDASMVTVTGTKRELRRVRKFLHRLMHRMHKQVLIEAKLIELVYNDSQTVGVDWSKFNLSIAGSRDAQSMRQNGVDINNFTMPNYFIGYNFSMNGLFDFLKKYGDIKILSNPKILTLNNQPAIINVGNQISYRYETGAINYTSTGSPVASSTYAIGTSFIGITLYVIPEITENNEIIMKINPVTSELAHTNETNNTLNRSLPPDVKIKQITSIVKVKDGQKVLIGGLISKNYSHNNNKVPLLGDVPIIGRLFHSTKREMKRSELFILIVPKIVEEGSMPTIDDVAIFKERR